MKRIAVTSYFTGLGRVVKVLFACFFPCMLVMSSNTFAFFVCME